MTRMSFGKAAPWLLLAFPLLLLLTLIVLPYAMTFYYSTTAATFGRLVDAPQVGLENFETILSSSAPSFPGVLLVTTIFAGGTLLGSLGLGTALALSLHTLSPSARSILLAIYLIPWVIAAVVIGYTWRLMYDPQIGLANTVLGFVGIEPISWLTNRATAVGALVVANIWASYGIVLLIMSGALANVPPNIILSGQIDGASYARIVSRVILPGVRPAFLLAGLVALVSGLNVFDLIYVTTGGGPLYQTETLALEMFRITTRRSNIGEGAAVTVVLFSLSLLLAIAYVVIWRREQQKWT